MTKLLSLDEVAERVDRTPATVSYWVHTGYAPPSAKIGRRRMWREEDVDRWINEKFEAAP